MLGHTKQIDKVVMQKDGSIEYDFSCMSGRTLWGKFQKRRSPVI